MPRVGEQQRVHVPRRDVADTTKLADAGEVKADAPGGAENGRAIEQTGAGHAQKLLALAKALLGGGGSDDDAKKLLDEVPSLREAVKLFSWLDGDTAAERCKRHCVVNTDAKHAKLHAVAGDVIAAAREYARGYGYADIEIKQGKLHLVDAEGAKVEVGKVDAGLQGEALLRALGRLINQKRVGAPTTVPPALPLDAKTREFSPANAIAACHMSMLAYETETNIKAQLQTWGVDMSTFKFVGDAHTDTQGFTFVDKQGHTHVVFRGTASGADAMTDMSANLKKVDWAPGVEVHAGFKQGIDAVWPQIQAALANAKGEVFFEGHSLGGALAQLAAVRAAATGILERDQAIVYTKGGPRVGNAAFKELAESNVPRTYRLVHSDPGSWGFDNDPVTGVPPRFMGYRHAGHMVKLTEDKTEVILAGTPGARSALATRMMNAAMGTMLEGAARRLDQYDDASDPPDKGVEALRGLQLSGHLTGLRSMVRGETPPTAAAPAAAAQDGAERAMRGAGPESNAAAMEASMLGVGLHFMAGYLAHMGLDLLRTLRKPSSDG